MPSIVRRSFLALSALAAVRPATADDPVVTFEGDSQFRVSHRASVVMGDLPLTELEIWLPLPISSESQTIQAVQVPGPMKVHEEETRTGRVARFFSRQNLPQPGENDRLELSYSVRPKAVHADLDRVFATRWDDAPAKPDGPSYLRREPAIEIDLNRIRTQAAELKRASNGPGRFAWEAYGRVIEQTVYTRMGKLKGAKFCLEKGQGECGDYSALFVALCRAAGVPARPVVGYLINEKAATWHVWAEFRLPTGEWIPVDGSGGDGDERRRKANFGHHDARRVALSRTFDIRPRKPSGGHSRVECLQSGAAWYSTVGSGTGPSFEYEISVEAEPG